MPDTNASATVFPGQEKIRIPLERAARDMQQCLAIGGPVSLPLAIRVTPTIGAQSRQQFEKMLGAPPYRPHNENEYLINSGQITVDTLKSLVAMDDVLEVTYAGKLKASVRRERRLR
jgi:hypothetical protein